MGNSDYNPVDNAEARRRAEARLKAITTEAGLPKTLDDARELIKEVLREQVELELRNEELQRENQELGSRHPVSITDTQHIRLKLQKTAVEFQLVFENCVDAILWADVETGLIIRANRAAEKLWEMPREKIVGLHQSQLHPSRTRDEAQYYFQKSSQQNTLHTTLEVLTLSGKIIPVEVITSLVEIEGKRILQGIFHDISERRRAEEAIKRLNEDLERRVIERTSQLNDSIQLLKQEFDERKHAEEEQAESENKFAKTFNTSQVIMAISSYDSGVYIEANEAFLEKLGYTRAEVIGKNSSELGILPTASRAAIMSKADVKGSVKNIELTVFAKNGRAISGLFSGNRIEIGGQACWLTTFVDITERKNAEEALRKLNHELKLALVQTKEMAVRAEAANTAKSEFLATMSHELRTPLNAIIGFTGLVLESELAERQRDYLEIVKKRAIDLLAIIRDILDLIKIETDKMEFADDELDLDVVINEAVDTIKLDAQAKNLSVRSIIAPDIPKVLRGDSLRLKQILINLVGNAVKFTESGTVTINASRVSDELPAKPGDTTVRFSVADTGIGVPDDKMGMIFEAFSQIDSTYSRKYGGTGLGLTICRHIVEKMGGKIWVESKLGEGSTFSFVIPLRKVSASSKECPPAPPSAPLPASPLRLRILVADDDPLSTRLIEAILSEYGYDLTLAHSGREAIDNMSKRPFDLVLMDIRMQGMNGIDTTLAIRRMEASGQLPYAKKRRTPIIAITAFAMPGDRGRFIASGIDDCLSKPIFKDALLDAICKWASIPNEERPATTKPAQGA